MNLTGQQIVDQGIIFGNLKEENIQQHGVDLNIIEVRKLTKDEIGVIPSGAGKTKLCSREIIPLIQSDPNDPHWHLEKGVYDIKLAQGCKIPPNRRLRIVHRSSLFRNGGQLNSAMFDAGFETDNIGTLMTIDQPIIIHYNARVGQAYTDESNVVDNLYNGQWQKDQQRSITQQIIDHNLDCRP